MSATAIQTSPAQLSVIGRYTVSEEARVLVGRRIEGKVFVYDYPRHGQGRRYFVESGFESKAELAVLLADYRREAKRLGTCPMSHDAIERAFELAALALANFALLRTPPDDVPFNIRQALDSVLGKPWIQFLKSVGTSHGASLFLCPASIGWSPASQKSASWPRPPARWPSARSARASAKHCITGSRTPRST